MKKLLALIAVAGTLVVAGCGGNSDEASEPLRDGVYEYELTEEYLLDNSINTSQAADESGRHEVTLDGGEFVDRWKTAESRTGACSGTYESEGNRVTFTYVTGCFGDWEMSYSVDGDTVTWSDQEALPPYDSDEDQNINEVFNSVPWMRIGDVPES